MVFAVGARYVNDERLPLLNAPANPVGAEHSRGFDFFRTGSLSASPSLVSSTLYDLQSSVLAIVWLCGAASPISAWSSVGFALRRAVDVGAHREVRSRWTSSPLVDEMRKRAFYALFGLDRA